MFILKMGFYLPIYHSVLLFIFEKLAAFDPTLYKYAIWIELDKSAYKMENVKYFIWGCWFSKV